MTQTPVLANSAALDVSDVSVDAAIDRATKVSRWTARTLRAHPDWQPQLRDLVAAPLDGAALLRLLETENAGKSYATAFPVTSEDIYRDATHLGSILRRVRAKVLLALIARDLAGLADLREVMRAMSTLAELCIQEALQFLTPQLVLQHGQPTGAMSGLAQDLIVVGMGKLGGGELNVSSDIDLIFFYGEAGETMTPAGSSISGRSLSNHEFFALLGRKLIAVLSEATADGFVFRVDMALRPNGDSGPLAVSLAMLEEYFMTQGRDWERFAWIKGRIVSKAVLGPSIQTMASQLDTIVRPFAYRRYLDFGSIEALRRLHRQIRAEVGRQEVKASRTATGERSGEASAYKPINVKLGRGGIREIEFIVQHFQLIRGGRDTDLRERSTLGMLQILAQKKMLDAETTAWLTQAYVFLRAVEHRLQYLDDAQTHVLPREPEALERIHAMCAPLLANVTDAIEPACTLEQKIASEQAYVARVFDEVFGEKNGAAENATEDQSALWSNALLEPIGSEAAALLNRMGYADAEATWSRLRALWTSSKLRTQTAQSRERIDALVPLALTIAGRKTSDASASPVLNAAAHYPGTTDSVTTLGRLLDLFEAIAGRSSYLAFLNEFPQALERVARVLAASPWAARYLRQHPLLLDELLDAPTGVEVDWSVVAAGLASDLQRIEGDVERQMDLLREVHHAQIFRLLTQDLAGHLTVEALSDHLAALADLIVEAAIGIAWRQLLHRHREQPRFAVIAYGKLGGKELGYASDLDIIFLYDDSDLDDPGKERSGEIYARLAQRLITLLTMRTPAGSLFEIDLALRPDGGSGLLVSSLAAYRKYQEHSAWVWEHQALTRARFCAGARSLGVAFEKVRRSVLAQSRNMDGLRREVIAMRKKMHEAHPNRQAQQWFDLKHDSDGMIDIEFATQYLVLAYSHAHAELLDDVGNIALLLRAAAARLIDASLAHRVGDAYREYRKLQHALRLAEAASDVSGAVEGAPARVNANELKEERAAVRSLWQDLFEVEIKVK